MISAFQYLSTLVNKQLLPLQPIINALALQGAKAYLVGGCPRDLFLHWLGRGQDFIGDPMALDLDIEVHHIGLDSLELLLKKFGSTILVGKQFGVLKLTGFSNVDWSIPRQDSIGRHPQVSLDPDLNIVTALLRRDVTINALAIDLTHLITVWQEIQSQLVANYDHWPKILGLVDPYGGLEDLRLKRLRPVSVEKFGQDPLRFFRAMHFLARFELSSTLELDSVCKRLELFDVQGNVLIAPERITQELIKLMLRSRRPSLGFQWLVSIQRLAVCFPQLHKLNEEQWLAFCASLDRLSGRQDLSLQDERLITIMLPWAYFLDQETLQDWFKQTSFNHKVALALYKVQRYWSTVETLSEFSDADLKLLAYRLAPSANLNYLFKLLWAVERLDESGYQKIKQRCQELNIWLKPEAPVLTGNDLLSYFVPGPELGDALKRAYFYQITQSVVDKTCLLKFLLS